MDIKGIIEFLEGRDECNYYFPIGRDMANKIITLLKRGEKCEAILEKVKRIISSHSLIWLETFITELEKEDSLPVKKTITIKMDAKDKEALLTHFSKCFNVDIKEGD